MASKEYFKYPHNNTSEDTVLKFWNNNSILVKDTLLIDFIKYKGDTEKTNVERVYEKYLEPDRTNYLSIFTKAKNTKIELLQEDVNFLSEIYQMPLYPETILLIPKYQFVSELASIKGKNLFLEQSNNNIFFWSNLYNLLSDPDYVKSDNLAINGRDLSVEIINENVRIWVWSRALNKIINISPFIISASTNKADIGTFSLQLSPIKSIEDVEFLNDEEVVSFFNLNEGNKNTLDFFYKNFQYNDIVFIRFEKLKMEDKIKDSFLNSIEGGAQQLPSQIWDMIGLIDNVSQSSLYSGVTDYIVNISGRDLMKLLVEDGSYFLSLRYLNNGEGNFAFGYNREDKWFKRNIGDKSGTTGTFDTYHFPLSYRSINDTIGFIINQLSNIGITEDDSLFSYYGKNKKDTNSKRTETYIVSDKDNSIRVDEVNGIWQIIKVFFDRKLRDRSVVDSSISYVDSTIFEQFNKICQKPFVEFFGDTYGNQFNFVVRQPPFTRDEIVSFLNGVYINDNDYFSNSNGNIEVEINRKRDYDVITLNEQDIDGYNNIQWENIYYSWYQLTPQDKMLGQFTELMAGGFIPIVYFDRMTQIFGNHRLAITDNYLNSGVTGATEETQDSMSYREKLFNDFKYIIDSNSYLPFTRKGSITIPKGDRRIKMGTFIRIAPTNEIFYVDSVSHSISFSNNGVNRSTTINISRGMLEKYIYGGIGFDNNGAIINSKGEIARFSYFDIIKTKVDRDSRGNLKFISKLDDEQFDFFLKRMQFNKLRGSNK